MGKVLDFWTGREIPQVRQTRIDQSTYRQLCEIAGYGEVFGILTPDDFTAAAREQAPDNSDIHVHPWEMTSRQASWAVRVLMASARNHRLTRKAQRLAKDYREHGLPAEWVRPHGHNSRRLHRVGGRKAAK